MIKMGLSVMGTRLYKVKIKTSSGSTVAFRRATPDEMRRLAGAIASKHKAEVKWSVL